MYEIYRVGKKKKRSEFPLHIAVKLHHKNIEEFG